MSKPPFNAQLQYPVFALPEWWLQGWSSHRPSASSREEHFQGSIAILLFYSGAAPCWAMPASEAGIWCMILLLVLISYVYWKLTFICPLHQDTVRTTKITVGKCCLGANSIYSYVFYYCVCSAPSKLQFSLCPRWLFSLERHQERLKITGETLTKPCC